jgi:hypothetical protein
VKKESIQAALVLIALLHICFFPCLWGKKTLLESARAAPSIVQRGAWAGNPELSTIRSNKVSDPGAPAWQNEPWLALIHHQYLDEKALPLWNPYQAYGVPLAANMQSQPFYPLTVALALHPTPRTYNWYVLSRLFIAGFFMFLYLRLLVSFYPALAGGIACMFGGYYILFLTIPELSVAVLLPAFLFAGECLLRRQSYARLLGFAIVLWLIFLGGGPETTLLLLSFAYLYFLVRLLFSPRMWTYWTRIAKYFLFASVAGLALSMIVLLPFAQYLPNSFNIHEPRHINGEFRGLAHDHNLAAVVTYVFPLLLGPVNTAIGADPSSLRNYIGIVSLYLICIAVLQALKKPMRRDRDLAACTFFFTASMIFVLLKRFGILVNLVGALPFYRLIEFPKYQELLLSVSAAILVAFGLEHLARRTASAAVQWTSLGLTLAIPALAVLGAEPRIRKYIDSDHVNPSMLSLSVGLPCLLLAIVVVWTVWFNSRGPRHSAEGRPLSRGMGVTVVVALIAAEFCLNYIYPVYYQFTRMPSASCNPYVGAPYLSFLKSRCKENCRVIGQDGVLTPSWAAAFQISDIRYVDALYVEGYFPFLQNFFPNWRSIIPELAQCFRGFADFDFTHPLTKRLLQLSSVKYLLATKFFLPPDETINRILHQNRERLATDTEGQVGTQAFNLGGDIRNVLTERPPYERLSYGVTVPRQRSDFHFSIALDSSSSDKNRDGVGFTIEVRDQAANLQKVFYRYLNPKQNFQERRWMDGQVDLTAYRGQTIELLFSTDPSPEDDPPYGWAGWAGLYFGDKRPLETTPFQAVYDKEVKISEFDYVLPRVSLYQHADLVSTDTDVLRELAKPAFDIFKSVVLKRSELDQRELKCIEGLNGGAPKPVTSGKILSYLSQDVRIGTTLEEPQF